MKTRKLCILRRVLAAALALASTAAVYAAAAALPAAARAPQDVPAANEVPEDEVTDGAPADENPDGAFAEETPAGIAGVVSDAYILMDAGTGQLLCEKNMDKQKYPASITKILTLGLTLQYGSLEDTLTVSETAIAVGPDAAHIALRPGEEVPVRDAAMATLLASANDAANCLAEYVSGSIEDFAALMNRTAERIGCTGSHFVNPSGLPDDGHYTTAHDMARITAWALTVPGFRELFGVTDYTMGPTNLQSESRRWGTQNAMIVESAYYYEGAWGGKLGWTTDAQHTMVTTLTREGRDLVLVVMDSTHRNEKYQDAALILDTALAQLRPLALQTAAAAPMYSGDTLLGQVPFAAEDLAIWAPQTVTLAQLEESWRLPERLDVGDTSPATLEVRLPAGDDCLPSRTVTLAIPQGSLEEVQTAWRSLQALGDGATAWHTVTDTAKTARVLRTVGLCVGIPAALVGLAYCVRWYNLARRNLRRYGTLRRPQLSAKEEGMRALAALRDTAGRQAAGKGRGASRTRRPSPQGARRGSYAPQVAPHASRAPARHTRTGASMARAVSAMGTGPSTARHMPRPPQGTQQDRAAVRRVRYITAYQKSSAKKAHSPHTKG